MVAKRTKLHILALVSLVTALAFLILLSVSKMTDVNHSFLGLGVATFNGASPTKLVDGKHGQTVGENLANIRVSEAGALLLPNMYLTNRALMACVVPADVYQL